MSTTEHIKGGEQAFLLEIAPTESSVVADAFHAVSERWQQALRNRDLMPADLWPQILDFCNGEISTRFSAETAELSTMSYLFGDALAVAQRRVQLFEASQREDKAATIEAQRLLVAARAKILTTFGAFDEAFVRRYNEVDCVEVLEALFIEATTLATQEALSEEQRQLTKQGVEGLLAVYKVQKALTSSVYTADYALPSHNKRQFHRLMVRRDGRRVPLEIVPSSVETELIIAANQNSEPSIIVPTDPSLYPSFSLRLSEVECDGVYGTNDRTRLLNFVSSRFV